MPAVSRLARIGVAATALIVLAADVGVWVSRRSPDRAGTTAPAGRADTRPDRRELDAVLPELQSFVEQVRGRRFLRPPVVELLAGPEFEARLRGVPAGPEATPDDAVAVGVLRALGLVRGEVDLGAVAAQQVARVAGFYDSRAEVLYARGGSPTPNVKRVLVHELTHALDDQHFGLDRPGLDDEAGPAFDALVEGSALVVDRLWYDSRTPAERAAIDAESGAGVPAHGAAQPASVLDALLAFPYEVGPLFVATLVAVGGMPLLDAAFTSPPTTTEAVLHPESYLAGEQAPSVPPPAAGGAVLHRGRIGEAGLLLLFGTAMDRAVATRAAAGWGNDGYVAWRDAARVCVRINLVMDSGRDTTEAVSALRLWARGQPAATVEASNPVTVTACA